MLSAGIWQEKGGEGRGGNIEEGKSKEIFEWTRGKTTNYIDGRRADTLRVMFSSQANGVV